MKECRESNYHSVEKKKDVQEKRDVLDRLLKLAGLDKDSHRAKFATFTNVIVAQRYVIY